MFPNGIYFVLNMTLKSHLKAAKNALISDDPASCIDYAEKALQLDADNYFANLFLGKAYHLQSNTLKATKYYKVCCEIDPLNELGWRGLLLLVRESEDYDLFLSVVKAYSELKTKKNESLTELAKEVDTYLNKFGKNEDLYIAVLNSMTSFGTLGNLIGNTVISEERSLILLIDILGRREERAISTNVNKAKIKLSNNLSLEAQNQISTVKWAVYSKSRLSSYISRLLEICEDNELQIKYDNLWLSYQLDVLACAPNGDIKTDLQKKIFKACEGIIAVKREVRLAWDTYLNWLDPQNVDDLSLWLICDYIRLFGMEGLGSILYGFINSNYSDYPENKVQKYLQAEEPCTQINKEEERLMPVDKLENYEEGLIQFKSDPTVSTTLNDSELMSLYVSGMEKASASLLACRIVSEFYISLKEYNFGLMYCRKGINLLTKVLRDYGLSLTYTKESLLLGLAFIYTYKDAPKDHPKAFKLYESILQRNPSNTKAKIGKSLIFLQLKEFNKAKELLRTIGDASVEGKSYLGWCEINLGSFNIGRNLLMCCIVDSSLQDEKMKTKIRWWLAQSYLQESKDLDDQQQVERNINEAYSNLILCLKQDTIYAPAYTSLGIIYEDYHGDLKRANKCYYKAFELDMGQIESARRLVTNFSLEPDWESVRVLAQRVVDSEANTRILADVVDPAWPYRSLGCALLEFQEDFKAIGCFQSALKIDSKDVASWVGLGQAYLEGGRFEASIKIFNHLLEDLVSTNWFISYMLAISLSYERQFAKAISILEKLLYNRPHEKCILIALVKISLAKGQDDLSKGFIGRCIETGLMSLDFIFELSEVDIHCCELWSLLSETILLFTKVSSSLPTLKLSRIAALFQRVAIKERTLFEINDAIEYKDGYYVETANATHIVQAVSYMIQSAKTAIQVLPRKSLNKLRASLFYNLGTVYYHAFILTNMLLYLNCSIKPLQKAVAMEPVVAEYWIALGNTTMYRNARVAQHCYIKASSLSSTDHSVFVNLGALYLVAGDYKLAKVSFDRALSMQPDDYLAWEGLGFSRNELFPQETGTFNLFAHAMVLSNGNSPIAQLLYGYQVLKKISLKNKFTDLTSVERQETSLACDLMLRYLRLDSENDLALSVTLSLIEHTQEYAVGLEISNAWCSSLEKAYKEKVSTKALSQLATAKSQQARLYLGLGQYSNAIIAAKMALDMLGDDVVPSNSCILKCILSSRSVIGLSCFFDGQLSEALTHLKVCLENTDSYRLVILLAQILYAFDDDDTKLVALEELFNYIEEHDPSLPIVLTLSAIAITENLKDILPVAKDDLQALSLCQLAADHSRKIPQMINLVNHKLGIKENTWQKVVFLFPSDGKAWSKLESNVASEVFYNSKNLILPLNAPLVKTGKFMNIQRGIFLDPSQRISYKALVNCLPTCIPT